MEVHNTVNDKDAYLVKIFDEINILSNVLCAIAYWKRYMGEFWPREVVVQECNRLSISLGPMTKMRKEHWNLIDAIYMSKFIPIPDKHAGKRYPTIFKGKRKQVGKAFRDRATFV